MRTTLMAVVGALSLTVLGAGPIAAQAPTPVPAMRAPSGAPTVTDRSPVGYYIWWDGERVHLRTTDPGGDGSTYTGRIQVDGRIRDVELLRTEGRDVALRDGNTLEFRFVTYNRVDGVSFAAQDTSRITFRLERNGRLIRTEHIYIGPGGVNPPGNPFTLFR